MNDSVCRQQPMRPWLTKNETDGETKWCLAPAKARGVSNFSSSIDVSSSNPRGCSWKWGLNQMMPWRSLCIQTFLDSHYKPRSSRLVTTASIIYRGTPGRSCIIPQKNMRLNRWQDDTQPVIVMTPTNKLIFLFAKMTSSAETSCSASMRSFRFLQAAKSPTPKITK